MALLDAMHREMSSPRLARVSESNEEGGEPVTDDNTSQMTLHTISPSNSTPSLKRQTQNRSPKRSTNQLHVTINDADFDGNGSQYSNTSSRRPSALIQEILSTRRPSAIMAAIRSPKQFVNRYRRECVTVSNTFEFFSQIYT